MIPSLRPLVLQDNRNYKAAWGTYSMRETMLRTEALHTITTPDQFCYEIVRGMEDLRPEHHTSEWMRK